MPIRTITSQRLVNRLAESLRSDPSGNPGVTVIMGAGFSVPLIPTTTEIVRENLPWWLRCQRGHRGASRAQFQDQAARDGDIASTRAFAKEFWKSVKAAADEHGESATQFELDEVGLPTRADIGAAYRAALSPWCDCGLHQKAEIRQYFSDLVGGIKKRLNPAHLYLASMAAKHPRFARTIFTTNFDPLLQRALQLVNQPYFVSDRPDSMQHPHDEDGLDAIHVVHAHGSIYRYLLLNTPEEIERHAETNKYLLNAYFERHTVLIVGYSGWDDAITRSLEMVPQFAHALYWCDRGASVDQSSLSPAARRILEKHADAFYVPILSADQLMVDLHWKVAESSFPDLLRSPIETLIAQLRDCDFQGVTGRRGPDRTSNTSETVSGSSIDRGQAADPDPETVDLHEESQRIILRLESAQKFFEGSSIETGEQGTKRARALQRMNEAADRYFGKQYADAIRLLDEILRDPSPLSAEEHALSLFRRGVTHGQLGDSAKAIEDYTRVIDLPGAPPEQVAKALCNRGIAHGMLGDTAKAIDDCTRAIDLPGAPREQVANALVNRGIAYGRRGHPGDADRKIEDYTRAIDLPGATPEQVAKALVGRGFMHGQLGDSAKAIADYTRAIDLPGAPPEQVAKALFNRGNAYGRRGHPGDADDAIRDFTAAIDLPGAPPEMVAKALFNRGVAYGRRGHPGDADREIEDYTRAIDLPGAPTEQVAKALFNRGLAYDQRGHPGDADEAIRDFTAAIDLPGARPEQVAWALGGRALAKEAAGDQAGACDDVTRALAIAGVPEDVRVMLSAHRDRLGCDG